MGAHMCVIIIFMWIILSTEQSISFSYHIAHTSSSSLSSPRNYISSYHSCNQAEAKCMIEDSTFGSMDCNSLRINGTKAALEGFPDVQVRYTLKSCNYNTGQDLKIVQPSNQKFYHPTFNGLQNVMYEEGNIGTVLTPGDCVTKTALETLNTDRASYYIQSQLQGPSTINGNPVASGFCYAYAFNPVDFKYDYGLEPCEVSVSVIFLLYFFSLYYHQE